MKKRTNFSTSPKPTQCGMVLLEALVAVLLFSMGVLALVGLQATMIKNTADAELRSDASYIAQKRIGFIWANPTSINSYAASAPVDISDLLPNGTQVTGVSGTQVTVTINWQQPGKAQHHFTTVANITP